MNTTTQDWAAALDGQSDAAHFGAALRSGEPLVGKVAATDTAVIRVSGDDAASFLHAQFAAEIAQLEPGAARLTAWCSPKGRVLFLVRVMRAGEDFLVLLPADQAEPFTRRLGMFVLRARVTVAHGDDAGVIRCAGVHEQPAVDAVHAASDGDQTWFVGEPTALTTLWRDVPLPVLDAQAATLASIQRGVAELGAELTDKFLPQELNLDLVAGISFDKGCYPGQEIIARVRYRGRVKKRLQRFHYAGVAHAAPGDPVQDNDGASAGVVVCNAGDPAGNAGELLAVVDSDAPPVFLAQTPLTPRPLPVAPSD